MTFLFHYIFFTNHASVESSNNAYSRVPRNPRVLLFLLNRSNSPTGRLTFFGIWVQTPRSNARLMKGTL